MWLSMHVVMTSWPPSMRQAASKPSSASMLWGCVRIESSLREFPFLLENFLSLVARPKAGSESEDIPYWMKTTRRCQQLFFVLGNFFFEIRTFFNWILRNDFKLEFCLDVRM